MGVGFSNTLFMGRVLVNCDMCSEDDDLASQMDLGGPVSNCVFLYSTNVVQN